MIKQGEKVTKMTNYYNNNIYWCSYNCGTKTGIPTASMTSLKNDLFMDHKLPWRGLGKIFPTTKVRSLSRQLEDFFFHSFICVFLQIFSFFRFFSPFQTYGCKTILLIYLNKKQRINHMSNAKVEMIGAGVRNNKDFGWEYWPMKNECSKMMETVTSRIKYWFISMLCELIYNEVDVPHDCDILI